MRKHISTTPQPSGEGQTRKTSGRRALLRGAVGAAAVASLAVGLAGTAFAVDDPGSTDAHVTVDSAIALTALPASFALNGIPGATLTSAGAVTYTVATNNLAGYAVTVQSEAAALVGTGTNAETIPIDALTVRETGPGTFTALSDTAPLVVHTQDTKSAALGDSLSNDFRIAVPFVNNDIYSTTLDYVATTL